MNYLLLESLNFAAVGFIVIPMNNEINYKYKFHSDYTSSDYTTNIATIALCHKAKNY